MCGILAVVGRRLPEDAQFEQALDLLAHRGPDDAGRVRYDQALLGNRRLSILDLSPAGHQPFVDEETGVALTYNGEVFNYVELRRELERRGHAFRSTTDTEVVLRAYLEWGESCVERLNGMWGFAIWDPRTRRSFLARDRFGEKPFYYTMTGAQLSAASEPKSLLSLYPELRRPDDAAVYALLTIGCRPTSRSFYEGIRSLPPGCAMTYAPGDAAPRVWRYWRLPEVDPDQPTEKDAVDRFGELLEDAVRIRMRSDVPVGLTLSGGLDSTGVLQATSRTGSAGLTAFTSVYPTGGNGAFDERDWAVRAAAQHPDVRLEPVQATEDDWLEVLRRIVWHLDGPGDSPAVFPLWKIMEHARARGVPVLLEGQGGDELLGGYGHHVALAMVDSVEATLRRPSRRSVVDAASRARAGIRSRGADRFAAEVAAGAFPGLKRPYRRLAGARSTLRRDFVAAARAGGDAESENGRRSGGRLEQVLIDDFSRRTLPGFLHYGDAIAMAHSVENRLPFLDYRLVEYCFRLAGRRKLAAGETKRLLREYLRRGGHRTIADRLDKKGYPTPVRAWMSQGAARLPRELLLGRGARIHRYAARRRLERLVSLHARGLVASEQLYRLVETEIWLQTCIGEGS